MRPSCSSPSRLTLLGFDEATGFDGLAFVVSFVTVVAAVDD